MSVSFDEPNLIGAAEPVPVMELAVEAGLHQLSNGRLSVPGDKGANAGAKVAALVAGMCAGDDSIDDMAILLTHVKMPAWIESLTYLVLPASVIPSCVG